MNPRRFYLGLFALTFATLMLEVIETRLLSVLTWYHLAFFVISAAMFGMTAGAVWIYLNSSRHTAESLPGDLRRLTTGFAASAAVSVAVQTTLSPAMVASLSMAVVFAELALAIATPFFFSGAAVSLALTRSPFPIGRVYAVDLAGASLGCLGVLVVLGWTGAPSAILLVAAIGAAAAGLFAEPGGGPAVAGAGFLERLSRRPWRLCALLAALGLLNAATPHGIQPILVKERVEARRGEIAFEKWNSFSRVIVRPPVHWEPKLWGPSPKVPVGPVSQIWMNIDGDAGTVMYPFDGNVEPSRFLTYDVTNLVYFLRASGRSAIIGVGGGRDVLSAWVFGVRDVIGVELNPAFVDLLTRRPPYVKYAGLGGRPGIRLVADEARSWFSRSRETFDTIQMSMIDTWAATGAGAFTLSENGLYTLEAWTIFLARLSPNGLFSVSRWYAPGEVNETGRMISLATAALLERGVKAPRRHLFVASCGSIATLILARAPLTETDIERLRRVCADLGYGVLLSPDAPPASALLERIVSSTSLAALVSGTSGLDLDLTPPTDNRPFFFNLLPLARPLAALRFVGQEGVIGGNLLATWTLLVILVVSAALVAVTIVVPLRPALRDAGVRAVRGGTLYFAMLGIGFMLVEMGMLQRFSVFLGHPVYSLSIVLFCLILCTGIGSWLSEGSPLSSRGRFLAWALLIVAYVGSLPHWLSPLLAAFETASIPLRGAVCAAVIAPAGVLMGYGFPTGMRLARRHGERPTVWFWGINGAAGVLASVLAVVISLAFGIGATMAAGAACYLALIPAAEILGFVGNERSAKPSPG